MKINKILPLFNNITSLYISYNQFKLFLQLYSGETIPNLYDINYNSLYEYILTRTDIPLRT